MHIYLVSQRGK